MAKRTEIQSIHPRSVSSITPASHAGLARLISLAWIVCCASLMNAASAMSAEPIKIGAVLPFSGGVELYGAQTKLGLDLAVKEINAAGGILGRPVEVIYEDDKTDPAAAVDATRELIERDGVLALVGRSPRAISMPWRPRSSA